MEKTRKIRSIGRRSSSILKIDFNKEEDTKVRRVSRRVSFADTCQVKEFPKDSPQAWKKPQSDDEGDPAVESRETASSNGSSHTISGLDKLLTGTIKSPLYEEGNMGMSLAFSAAFTPSNEEKETDTVPDHIFPLSLTSRYSNSDEQSPVQTVTNDIGFQSFQSSEMSRVHFEGATKRAWSEEDENKPDQLENVQRKVPRLFTQPFTEISDNTDKTYCASSLWKKLGWNPSKSNRLVVDDEISFRPTAPAASGDMPFVFRPVPESDVNDEHVETTGQMLLNHTMHFNNQAAELEETVCVGGIVEKVNDSVSGVTEKNNASKDLNNESIVCEETVCVGGILDPETANRTMQTGVTLVDSPGMDETKCVGGILKSTLAAEASPVNAGIGFDEMEETRCLGMILNGDATLKNIDGMEETKCVGGILNKTKDVTFASANKTLNGMEETKCIGGILSRTGNATLANNTQTHAGMEETKCVGGILSKMVDVSFADVTQTQGRMEDTTCVGGILNKTKDVMLTNATQLLDGMEETKCVGGILNKTKDVTLANATQLLDGMEEIKCMGGILNKTKDVTLANANQSLNGMEETNCVGGILNRTKDIGLPLFKGSFVSTAAGNMEQKTEKPVTESCLPGVLNRLTDASQKENVAADNNLLKTRLALMTRKSAGSCGDLNQSKADGMTDVNTSFTEPMKKRTDSAANKDVMTLSNQNTTLLDTVDLKRSTSSPGGGLLLGNSTAVINGTALADATLNMTLEELSCSRTIQDTGSLTGMKPESSTIRTSSLVPDKTSSAVLSHGSDGSTRQQSTFTESEDNETTDNVTRSTSTYEQLREKLILSKRKSFSSTVGAHNQKHSAKKLNLGTVNAQTESEDEVTKSVNTNRADGEKNMVDTSRVSAKLPCMEDGNIDDEPMPASIDDEPMPDCMMNVSQQDLIANEPIPDGFSTSFMSFMRQSNNDMHSSSSSGEMSVSRNKSFQSFTFGDGPVTVESFKKMMRISYMGCQNSRRSRVCFPSVSLRDKADVLLANITLAPQIRATNLAYTEVEEQTSRNKETIDRLQQTLEANPPPIFQECLSLSDDELGEIQGLVVKLWNHIRDVTFRKWKDRTGQAVQQAVTEIQGLGKAKAETLLSETRADNRRLEQLLTQLDEDTQQLENRKTSCLNDLKEKQFSLTVKSKQLSDALEDQERVLENLYDKQKHAEDSDAEKKHQEHLIEQIKLHLMLNDWSLESLSEDQAVFHFLQHELALSVWFSQREDQILSLKLSSTVSDLSKKPWLYLTHHMAKLAINTQHLQSQYKCLSSLSQLLQAVSGSMNEISQLRRDLYHLSLMKKLTVTEKTLAYDACSKKSLNMVTLAIMFDTERPMSSAANFTVSVNIGDISKDHVLSLLKKIQPGAHYLTRLHTAFIQSLG